MLQAKVHTIYYLHEWAHPIGSLQQQYEAVQREIPGGVRAIAFADPKADWANGRAGEAQSDQFRMKAGG